MGLLKGLLIGILLVSFIVFVIFFGRLPALRNTPIGTLNKLILVKLPNVILALENAISGGRLSSGLMKFGSFLINDRHPTILIFFLLLLTISEYMYLPAAWPYMSSINKILGSVAVALPYIFLYLSAFTDPGYITPDTHVHYMGQYPYDFSVYHPGTFCHTCRLLKPARSKHCSVCKKCVSKMDHHCIFLNKCVGQENHRYFILLLLSTAVLATYGGCLGISILSERILIRYPLWAVVKPTMMSWSDYMMIWSWALERNTMVGAITLLCMLCSPMVWSLLGYTLFLVYCGTTTNESLKWSDWKADMKDGFVWRRSMSLTREKHLSIEPAMTRWPFDTEQILTRTQTEESPDPKFPGKGEWTRVHSLREVDNMYDLGFLGNLKDIFFRDYQFRDLDREKELTQGKNGLPPFENTRRRLKRRAKAAAI